MKSLNNELSDSSKKNIKIGTVRFVVKCLHPDGN